MVEKVLQLTQSAYSINRYRSWEGVAKTILSFGYSVEETAAIMNSKQNLLELNLLHEQIKNSQKALVVLKHIFVISIFVCLKKVVMKDKLSTFPLKQVCQFLKLEKGKSNA
jgi:hypothetical protein